MLIKILSRLKTPENNSSITAPGAHILLDFDDARSFDTPRINNHNVTATSTPFVLGGDSAQYFETHPKENHGVTAPNAQILLLSDSLKCKHNNRNHRPVQNLLPPGN